MKKLSLKVTQLRGIQHLFTAQIKARFSFFFLGQSLQFNKQIRLLKCDKSYVLCCLK